MNDQVIIALAKKFANESKLSPSEVKQGIEDYLDENPEALDQAAVEAIAGQVLDNIVLIQNQQPTSDKNKLWILSDTVQETDVPTYQEFTDLNNDVDGLRSAIHYVTPQQYGAKGDGITDDTQAIMDCIAYAQANHYAVHIPMGTYIVTGGLSFTITDGQSVVIIGDGQNTIIKRKDASLSGKWSQIFTFIVSPVSAHANDVLLSNFCIDSNRRGQGDIPADSYAYEASMDISIRGSSSGTLENDLYLDRFIVDNMRFYDPVADCINVSGSMQIGIRDIFINRVVATDRHGTRNDIGFTGNPLHGVWITKCDCGSIHFEYNSAVEEANIIPYVISECRFETCTLGAQIDLEMSNCIVDSVFLLNSMRFANVHNCKIALGGSYTLHSSNYGDYYFTNCTFVSQNNVSGTGIWRFYNWSVKRCELKNCKFVFVGDTMTVDLDGDGVNDHVEAAVLSAQSNMNDFVIDGCDFDPRFAAVIDGPSSNKITFKNMEINTGLIASGLQTLSDRLASVFTLENVKLGTGCLRSINVGHIHSLSDGFVANGVIITLPSNFAMYANTVTNKRSLSRLSGDLHRLVKVNVPVDDAFMDAIYGKANTIRELLKGDTFIYDGPNPERYPQKWVAVDSGITEGSGSTTTAGTPMRDRLMSVGSGYGGIKHRPSCYLSPGFEYFDTDLEHKVYWSGSKWINADGTDALNLTEIQSAFPSFTTKYARALPSFDLEFGPIQDGTGNPSSENIRALSGHTGATIKRYGKNLCPAATGTDMASWPVTEQKHSYTITGLDPNQNYTLQATITSPVTASTTRRLYLIGATDKFINTAAETAPVTKSVTVKPNADGELIIAHNKNGLSNAEYAAALTDIMLSVGSTASEYIMYSEPVMILTEDWTSNVGPVYGGHIDVIAGKLYAAPYYASYDGETLVGPWISDRDVYAPENPDTPPTTGAQVVDLGGTPTEYGLTACEIQSVIGLNNFWNDLGGTITLDYWN